MPSYTYGYGWFVNSPFIPLLPFLEQQTLYRQIMTNLWNAYQYTGNNSPFPTPLSVMICPSDPGSVSSPVANLGTGQPQGSSLDGLAIGGTRGFDLGCAWGCGWSH